ncbi:MAG: hypoxanthine phosphoribosyltransferase [Bacteroidetes bacterium]|nr:MAG: hypoxanthine phosphoribosyltransferase [Bacteroidota bacterium]PTM14766.1 MAG: hypoxanthine phosphoribosyltransferase [Bacteroidota bacterium]
MSDRVQLHDLFFTPFLTEAQIQTRVAEIGQELSEVYRDQRPVFLVMLKGAFVFATDLVRCFAGDAEVSFVRTQSYAGTTSTQEIKLILGPEPAEVHDRHIIIIEDIVDSGYTMHNFLPVLQAQAPRSVKLVTLLFKPDMLKKEVPIDYVGFSIPPKFVVGYGLDYNGLGRNLREIYQLAE